MPGHGQVQSYRDLEVYQIAFAGAVKVHKMTMGLPKHEMYEVGSQVRRSAKGIPANIAEGFGRRRYKNEYLHFLTIALASCDETQVHLELLHATAELDDSTYESLTEMYSTLGRKLNRLLQSVLDQHVEPYRDRPGDQVREDGPDYSLEPEE
jgi:four helix bundle protein